MAVPVHKNDVKASNIYFISVALSAAVGLLYAPPFHPTPLISKPKWIGSLVFVAVFFVLQGLGIRRGYKWVKVLFIICTVAGISTYLYRFTPANEPLAKTLLTITATAFQLWAFYIIAKDLLTRRSSAAPEAGVVEGRA
jgi:O-antigen/teichoic acid export membrane protein